MEPSPNQQSEEDQVGWARQLKNGNWSGRYRDANGDQKVITSYPTEADAIAAALLQERAIREATWTDPTRGKQTFGSYATEIMAGRASIAPSTRERDDRYMRLHIMPTFANSKLVDITRRDIQKWMAQLDMMPRTKKECRRLLSMVLAEAVDDGLIHKNSCHKIEIPRPDDAERRYLTERQVEILAASLTPRFRPCAFLSVYGGGLRWGEVFGLQRRHINVTEKTLRVDGTLQRVGGINRYVAMPKTEAGRRTVELDPWLLDMVVDHLQTHEHEFLFPSRTGGPTSYSNFRQRHWNPAVARAGLAPLTFHALRHTAAALMHRLGATDLELMRFLGHRDITTTRNVYGHLFTQTTDATRTRMSAARAAAAQSATDQHGSAELT